MLAMSLQRDPHDIIPDDFVDRYPDADSVPEALAMAERETSSTPKAEMERCIACGSVKIRTKKARIDIEHMRDESYRCEECGTHADQKAPPLAEFDISDRAKQTDFEWVVWSENLDDSPEPGLHPDLPDLQERDADEAARWAVLLTKPWDDDDGMSIRDAAEHIPFSRQFVTRRKQMWRAGELDPRITAEAYLRELER